MDGLHVERVPQNEFDAVFFTQIRDPVPAVHALDANIAERFEQGEQGFRAGFDFLVQQHLPLLVDDADIQAAGVQVDSTIMAVGAMVKVH